MKSYGHLYEQICSFENLLLAARKAQRGKRFRENVGRFNLGLERELLALQEELRGQTYRPGGYREFKIFRPKACPGPRSGERLISAAPYRDRVVHHALCNVIEPLFDRTFIHDSYACRKGKGTHRAVNRLTAFCRRSRYALQCDIRKYFPSIDHEILLGLISRKIRDKQVLGLIRVILDASNPQEPVPDLYFEGDDPAAALARRRGIPIGNLISQFFNRNEPDNWNDNNGFRCAQDSRRAGGLCPSP
ncbi:MAG: hypothetical protein HYY20_07455 [Candidatus Tectomicrobia bacterium]|uniref:Reverse transcriptase domain-containing protein n=1 Tax=Tectimicrobiota bacterium TaxID=2528274 RepID=A0A932FWU4_UNCTE|nr:hypothetical protein [Candidatus Tectomicrobia bacterium]